MTYEQQGNFNKKLRHGNCWNIAIFEYTANNH